jgi:hypothetical protein
MRDKREQKIPDARHFNQQINPRYPMALVMILNLPTDSRHQEVRMQELAPLWTTQKHCVFPLHKPSRAADYRKTKLFTLVSHPKGLRISSLEYAPQTCWLPRVCGEVSLIAKLRSIHFWDQPGHFLAKAHIEEERQSPITKATYPQLPSGLAGEWVLRW